MTRYVEYDSQYRLAGNEYYKTRILPTPALIQDWGYTPTRFIAELEVMARTKWEYGGIYWSTSDFQEQLERYNVSLTARIYSGVYDLPLIVPVTSFFYDAYAAYPNMFVLYGEKNTGKTIKAWLTAYALYKRIAERDNKYEDFQIWVYGDVDGLTASMKRHSPDRGFRESLIFIDDYTPPKIEKNVAKMVIYNELGEEHMSGPGITKEQKELNETLFRSRHYNFWIAYNVIREMNLEKTARISSTIQDFKPLSFRLKDEILDQVFKKMYWRVPMSEALTDLSYRESLSIISLMRPDLVGLKGIKSGTTFTITPVIAPDWVLEAAEKAEKNYEVGHKAIEKKKNEFVEYGAKLYLEGMALRQIAIYVEEEKGFKRNHMWWSDQLTKYFRDKGFGSLREVKQYIKEHNLDKKDVDEQEEKYKEETMKKILGDMEEVEI